MQDSSKGSKNLQETFKKNPAAIVQLKNMTPSWNVGKQTSELVQKPRKRLLSICHSLGLEPNIFAFTDTMLMFLTVQVPVVVVVVVLFPLNGNLLSLFLTDSIACLCETVYTLIG